MWLPNLEVRSALGTDCHERVEAFSRLYKDGTLYYSTDYTRASHNKRDDTVCSFHEPSSDYIIWKDWTLRIVTKALWLCYANYSQQINHWWMKQVILVDHNWPSIVLLSSYIVPIVIIIPTSSTPLIFISLLSKTVIVSVSDKHYAIAQPNNVEYHWCFYASTFLFLMHYVTVMRMKSAWTL
jgi:hypothetical protein